MSWITETVNRRRLQLCNRMAETLNTRLTVGLYYKIKITVVRSLMFQNISTHRNDFLTDVVLKYFLEYVGLQNDFHCKISAWIRRILIHTDHSIM